MIFREITLEDGHLFDKYKDICSDYVFSYLFMYKDLYKLHISDDAGAVVIRSDNDGTSFYMPLGNTMEGIKAVLAYCEENNITPMFSKIPEAYLGIFNDFGFRIEEDRDSFDYVFRNLDFLEYQGKEFRNQRNNLYSYLRNFEPSFSEDIKSYIEKCKAFTEKYHNSSDKLEPTLRMLDSIDLFGLKGGVVLNQDEVAAFCLYEKVSEDMVVSHVELTDNSHRGVHAYLIHELAKVIGDKYINKEDDMGIEGLRRFKETYNPCTMIRKFKAQV